MTNSDLTVSFARQLYQLCPDWLRKRFVIALSGGADSTALTLMASAALGTDQLVLAHLNHGLRAEAAQADEDFCRRLAKRLNRPFVTQTVPVAALARQRRRGLEEAGRWARYDFLEAVRQEAPADYILTGHHQDDLVETLLIGLLRGTGPAGLAAIPPQRGLVLRPLLESSRSQIESWLRARNESWREDATNQNPRFLRNRIRLELRPFLEDLAPGCSRRLARLSRDLRLEEDYWEARLAQAAFQSGQRNHEAGMDFDRQALATLEPALAKRLIRRGLWDIHQKRQLKEPPDHLTIEAIWSLTQEPGQAKGGWDLPGGFRVEATRTRLHLGLASRLLKCQAVSKKYSYPLKPSQSLLLNETGQIFQLRELTENQAVRYLRPDGLSPGQYLLTEKQMFSGDLKVRSPKSEDWLRLKKGRQKLNRIFSQAEVPHSQRTSWPVLEDEEVLWVVGLKRRHYEPTRSEHYYLLEVSGPDF